MEERSGWGSKLNKKGGDEWGGGGGGMGGGYVTKKTTTKRKGHPVPPTQHPNPHKHATNPTRSLDRAQTPATQAHPALATLQKKGKPTKAPQPHVTRTTQNAKKKKKIIGVELTR